MYQLADPTQTIRYAFVLEEAAFMLIISPGARWFVPTDKLAGHPSRVPDLVDAVKAWDTAMFLVEQFELRYVQRPLGHVEFLAWDDAVDRLLDAELKADTIRKALMS